MPPAIIVLARQQLLLVRALIPRCRRTRDCPGAPGGSSDMCTLAGETVSSYSGRVRRSPNVRALRRWLRSCFLLVLLALASSSLASAFGVARAAALGPEPSVSSAATESLPDSSCADALGVRCEPLAPATEVTATPPGDSAVRSSPTGPAKRGAPAAGPMKKARKNIAFLRARDAFAMHPVVSARRAPGSA